MKTLRAAAVVLALLTMTASTIAQGRGGASQPPTTQPPATQPPPGTQPAQPARPRPAVRPSPPKVTVRDQSGTPVPGAKLVVSGPVSSEFTTNEAGSATFGNLRDGTYRLRCEHEGFVTLEREFTVRSTQPLSIELTLNRVAAPPTPLPAPAPPPAPKPVVTPPPVPPSGPPVTLSIPDYVDKNFVGRDPLKESVLACNGLETVRLLQLRDPIAEHTHSNMDEVLYVVAGDGAIRLGTNPTNVSAGSLVVVPHGTPHAVDRRGRNPLIVLSTLTGAPCPNAR